MDRRSLWKALRSRGVPAILLDLISALHNGTAVRVRVGQELSGHLLTTSGVRQGCVLAPSLFCIAIDWILRHMTSRPGITVGQQHFTDLVYADDTTFLVDSPTQASSCLSSFSEAAAVFGLRISWPKTKIQNVGSVYSGRRKSRWLCLDLHISRKSIVIRWILPTRRPQADHFGLISNVVFGLYLEGTPATPSHQNTLYLALVQSVLCLRDMDSHFSRCQVPGGIPYEMPTLNPENLVEAIRSQLGNICAHWSTCHQRRHPTSSDRRLWSHRQTAWQHPST